MVELRPEWCGSAEEPPKGLTLGDWTAEHVGGKLLEDCDGDDWLPGVAPQLKRTVEFDPTEVRRSLDLSIGRELGLAVHWYCKETARAGVHDGGPGPLTDAPELSVSTGEAVAGSLVLETLLVVVSEHGDEPSRGATVWSDGWSTRPEVRRQRRLVLEGDEFRPRVIRVDFNDRHPAAPRSPFHVHIDADADLDDMMANVVAIELNADVFSDEQSVEDMSDALVETIRISWLSALARRFLHEEAEPHSEPREGTVGWAVTDVALRIAGDWDSARRLLADEPSQFEARVWSNFGESVS